jgi:replicative DNA helicase
MLTEPFINLCCLVLLSDNNKFTTNIITDIATIFASYEEEEIALQFRKKFSLSKTILRLKLEKKSKDQILDNIISSGHFQELDSYLKILSIKELENEKIDAAIHQINEKKQLVRLYLDVPVVEDFISKFNSNSFVDSGETLDYWNGLISKLHSNVLEEKRKESKASIKELDLFSDDFTPVLNQIEISYSGKNSISTGYKQLNDYLNGGFEPSRLYIFGGCSGDGKSVLLNNFVRNAVEENRHINGPMSIYVYFTLENLVDESLIRLYCSIENKKIKQVIKNFEIERPILEQRIKEWCRDHNSVVSMVYFPPTLTSVSDLISYCDLLKVKYEGRAVLRSVYVDYLDLLKAGQIFDLYRLEMGQITIDMKVAAVMQNIPWVTVTQLNRGAYNPKEDLSLANMSESIKKVEHSDFVGILRNIENEADTNQDIRIPSEYGDFRIIIGKNRSGPKNATVNLKSIFSCSRIEDIDKSVAVPFINTDVMEGAFL